MEKLTYIVGKNFFSVDSSDVKKFDLGQVFHPENWISNIGQNENVT